MAEGIRPEEESLMVVSSVLASSTIMLLEEVIVLEEVIWYFRLLHSSVCLKKIQTTRSQCIKHAYQFIFVIYVHRVE